eukprot:131178-Rhodomonas_salina.3
MASPGGPGALYMRLSWTSLSELGAVNRGCCTEGGLALVVDVEEEEGEEHQAQRYRSWQQHSRAQRRTSQSDAGLEGFHSKEGELVPNEGERIGQSHSVAHLQQHHRLRQVCTVLCGSRAMSLLSFAFPMQSLTLVWRCAVSGPGTALRECALAEEQDEARHVEEEEDHKDHGRLVAA